MVTLETRLTLEADEEAVVSFLNEHGGLLIRETDTPGLYWLILRPKNAPEETFYVRVQWTTYVDGPPSVRFADGIGGSITDPRAWPSIPGYRIGSFDICKPFTAEAYAVHPEWRTGPTAWNPTGNPFLWVTQTLQVDLNRSYGGRCQ